MSVMSILPQFPYSYDRVVPDQKAPDAGQAMWENLPWLSNSRRDESVTLLLY